MYYKFHDGLLVSLWYEIDGSFYAYDDKESVFETYKYLEKTLGKKYGEPISNRSNSRVDLQSAVLSNKQTLLLAKIWEIHNGDTNLTLYFSVKNMKGTVTISYENMPYKNQREQVEKDRKRDTTYSLENSDDL